MSEFAQMERLARTAEEMTKIRKEISTVIFNSYLLSRILPVKHPDDSVIYGVLVIKRYIGRPS